MLLPVCGAGGGRRGRRKRQAGVGFRTCGPPPKGPAAEGYRRRDCCRERGRKPDRIGRGARDARDAGALPLRGRYVARSDAREIFFGSMSRRFAKFVRKGRLRARRARRSESGNPEAAREDGVRPGSRMRRRSEGAVSTFGSRGRSGRRLRPGGRSSVGRMRQGASGAGRAVRAADRKADGRKEDAGCG